MQTPWKLLGEQATAPELIRLRRAALAHAHDAGYDRWTRSKRLAPRAAIAAAAGILLVAITSLIVWHAQRFDVYSTQAGERRVVTLADGSQIALDSRSEIKVRYSAHARELILSRGQARFDVAHDVERPFSVVAGGQKVIATGTAFNVDLLGSSLFVTLIEGHVMVIPQRTESADKERTLDVGEQLVVSPTSPPRVAHINVDRAIAWENGDLVFENEELATVVARVNRYAPHSIVIGDSATSTMRISGVFRTGDANGFVTTIVSYLPVQARHSQDGTIQLTSR